MIGGPKKLKHHLFNFGTGAISDQIGLCGFVHENGASVDTTGDTASKKTSQDVLNLYEYHVTERLKGDRHQRCARCGS